MKEREPNENGRTYTCRDFPTDITCCETCHEDMDYDSFYYETYYDRKGNVALVCCFVNEWIKEHEVDGIMIEDLSKLIG